MVSITLDDRDKAVLLRLRRDEADVESLAESADCPEAYLRDRLPDLEDNGLVRRVEGDVYAVTPNGQRVLESSPAGAMDNRIDTPAEVEEAIRSFDLRADGEEAVRDAFAFLHYWGEARESEIIDGVYSEAPAGFESHREWWDALVRDRLAALPSVEPPESPDGPWRYAETPTVDEITEDGRAAPSDGVTPQPSVKYALEHADLDGDERSVVRAAFEVLLERGEAGVEEIEREIGSEYDAEGDATDGQPTDLVREGLELLPGVERTDESGDFWRYRQPTGGPTSSGPEADPSDEPTGSPEESDE